MKILVIFTGGTIGSTLKDGWISTDKTTKYTLIENYIEQFGRDIEFVTAEPYYMLSENLNADKFNLLCDCVADAVNKDFDGIIVTHGTDTLHFSAAALQLAFGNAGIPIVFVSANYPLEQEYSNGHSNFEAAVSLIKRKVKGVFISYKNSDGKHFIHLADKALTFAENDDSICSLNKKPFGIYENGEIKILENAEAINSAHKTKFCKEANILVICAVPGDSFSYNLNQYKAVILRPYHSGTFNTENPFFVCFLKKAKDLNIPVFLVGAPLGATYETVKEYEKLNIIPLPNTTFATVYMRLWAAISENLDLKNLF